uniref:Dipeptidyl peptidase IV n=1 Tax=Ganoderma boninense TaxID=34458 RepID=A0A5K1JUF2_9APHY|nr:Dipeptidyl peptidase IV [Ganoderma boninense]
MPSYAVIGASRGIGLEYVRQLVRFCLPVILDRAAKQVSEITGGKLDYLIHNAANLDVKTVYKGFDDYPDMEELDTALISAYKVNTLGPIHAITAFLPLLRAADTKKIIVIGSGAGDPKSTLVIRIPHMVAYGMTKAAALLATTKFAVKLQDEGFVVVTLSPGMVDCSATAGADSEALSQSLKDFSTSVKKDTGIEVTPQTPQASVGAQLKIIDGLQASHNGLFLQHTGGEYGSRS